MGSHVREKTGQKHIRHETLGVAVELLLKSRLISLGFQVSDPILSTSYDFVTEYDGIFNTIQVKSVSVHSALDYYRVEVPVGGYSVLLAHIGPLDTTYVFPWDEIDRRWICVHTTRPNRYEKWKENWDILKEAH
jgi:hypothetical protein